MGRSKKLAVRAGLLAAAAMPFALNGGAAAAAVDENQAQITFTFEGQEVTCHLFGQSNVVDDVGSASSGTNGADDPRCISHLFVQVAWTDPQGQRRSAGSATHTGHDVDIFVDDVAGSFQATHRAQFLNCVDPVSGTVCELEFTTTPK